MVNLINVANITRDEVSKFVSFLERYDGNGEYMQGGVSKFIDTAATKTFTMKLRKTQVDPLRLTESVEVKLFHQMLEMETFETILTGKRNPKRFNDNHKSFQLALNVYLGTTYYKEEKNWDMLLNHYYDVLYDWHRELQSLNDRGLLVERTSSSNDKSKGDNRSSNDKSDRAGKSRQLDGYTVGRIIVPVCAS